MKVSLKPIYCAAPLVFAALLSSGQAETLPVPVLTLQDGTRLTCTLRPQADYYWGTFPTTSIGCHYSHNTLLFSNGAIEPKDRNSFKGGVYYSSLSVGNVPQPFLVRDNEIYAANTYTIVRPGLHYFPARAQFARRLAPVSFAVTGNLSSYGPTRTRLFGPAVIHPSLRSTIQRGVVNGEFYSDTMGPFYPCMLNASDEPGGSRIEFTPGWDLDVEYHILSGDVIAERMPIAAFHIQTGKPLNCVDFGRYPFEYRLTRGNEPIEQYPHFTNKKYNQGTCAYEQKLTSYRAFDDAHLSRGICDDVAAAYLSNDWLARFRLQMVASDVTVSWSLFPSGPVEPAYPGQWVPFSLTEQLYHYAKYPHTGGFYGRAVGWDLYAVSAAYDLATDPQFRRMSRLWLEKMYSLADMVALPTGITYSSLYDDIPYSNYGMPRTEPATPYFQVPIFNNGLFALHKVLNNDPTIAKRLICGSAKAIRALPKVVSAYGPPAVGPAWYLDSTATHGYGPSHWMHCFIHYAQAYRLSNDIAYINDMLSVGYQPSVTKMEADKNRNFWTESISVLH